eukprot:6834076-Pyramimonas_sp.AAC.1
MGVATFQGMFVPERLLISVDTARPTELLRKPATLWPQHATDGEAVNNHETSQILDTRRTGRIHQQRKRCQTRLGLWRRRRRRYMRLWRWMWKRRKGG